MPSFLQYLSTTLLLVVTSTRASISQTGQTFTVNGIGYFAAPNSVSIISLTADQKSAASRGEGQDLVPLTVLGDATNKFTASVFKTLVNNYTASDDVFNIGFLETVYLTHIGDGSANVEYPLGATLAEYGTKLFMTSRSYSASVTNQGQAITGWRTALPPGPYFLSTATGDVYQAYRLYSDVQSAFTEGVYENPDGTYSPLSAALSGFTYITVGVLSRLYFTKTAAKPLAGVRIGIKDIYDIAGLKTGCGSRAYFDLYPERTKTAPAVQRLIDAGAVIVGKMKTSQFANGESATVDWVDQLCPFNARGDGYQDPASSSSGPGAALGAYDWIDIALGSDTGGSIRSPAWVNGLFGSRPSWGLVTLDNVMPLSHEMDTAGLLTRSPVIWHTTAKVLYEDNISSDNFKSFPTKILTSDFPATPESEGDTVLLDFLAKLRKSLGAETSELDPEALWTASRPAEVPETDLDAYLKTVYPTLIAQNQYNDFTLPFYADYAAAHDGRRPFIDPAPLSRWAYGQGLPATAAEEADSKRKTFRDWWADKVNPRNNQTCSDSLILYSSFRADTIYRNEYLDPPVAPLGFGINRVSSFAEVPDFAFVIGQAAYNSTISLKEEYLPVSVDIVAAKGCDGMIFALAEHLLAEGIINIPKTGSLTF